MGARQIDYPSPFLGDRNFRPPDRFQLRLRTRRVESTGGVDEHETDNSDGLLNFPLGCQQQRLAMLRKSFLRRAWLTNPPNSPVSSGEEAVTLLQGLKGNYRALVADINLLGKFDGWEVAKRAREIDPAFPIIYMTGAAADEWASRGVPNSVLLTKPFAPAQLVTALSQLLNTSSQSSNPNV